MANDLRDVMIALHPPSLEHCKEVVDAWFPPEGSDGHICGCRVDTFDVLGGFGEDDQGQHVNSPHWDLLDPNSPKSVVEVRDWAK